MDEEKFLLNLIKQVKKRKALYDPNFDPKDHFWKEIANALSQTEEICKQKWYEISSTYKTICETQSVPLSFMKLKNWEKLREELQFLKNQNLGAASCHSENINDKTIARNKETEEKEKIIHDLGRLSCQTSIDQNLGAASCHNENINDKTIAHSCEETEEKEEIIDDLGRLSCEISLDQFANSNDKLDFIQKQCQ